MARLTSDDIALWHSAMRDTKSYLPIVIVSTRVQTKLVRSSGAEPSTATLDLHGMTVQAAHTQVLDYLERWKGRTKYVCVITGKSGDIRREFTHWITKLAYIRRVEVMNGGGSFKVYYRKK